MPAILKLNGLLPNCAHNRFANVRPGTVIPTGPQLLPAKYLPFDLSMLKAEFESAPGLVDPEDPSTFYFGACPYRVYQSIHLLTTTPNILKDKLLTMKKIVEVGSGLGICSFILSQLLPAVPIIQGVEIDQKLLEASKQMKMRLEQFEYDLSNVSFFNKDVRQQAMGDVDCVIGWFPLGEGITSAELVSVFKSLPKGGLVFELYNQYPLNDHNVWTNGFLRVNLNGLSKIAFHIYERV